mmetsp:Transcript_7652/g.28806  ORF Transcript_7652/g.28806 Transcript_7652/m.28806 type:complete len:253 (+) Transcript_7652:953-1711(+)
MAPDLEIMWPSRVTARTCSPLWKHRCRALSRFLQMTVFPTAYMTAFRTSSSQEMTSTQSLKSSPSERSLSFTDSVLMVSRGMNEAVPTRCCRMYSMQATPVFAVSTTMWSMIFPAATAMALWYFRCRGLQTSTSRPYTPGKRPIKVSMHSAILRCLRPCLRTSRRLLSCSFTPPSSRSSSSTLCASRCAVDSRSAICFRSEAVSASADWSASSSSASRASHLVSSSFMSLIRWDAVFSSVSVSWTNSASTVR